MLWEVGLFQSPKHHSGHHMKHSAKNYCILTNLLNPILDRLHFWSALENGLTFIGLEPNRGSK